MRVAVVAHKAGLGMAAVLMAACVAPQPDRSIVPATSTTPTTPAPATTPTTSGRARPTTVVAAGDIACSPTSAFFNGGLGDAKHCQMKATADTVARLRPDAVLPLGDLQYGNTTLADFQASYDQTWGRFKAISHPVVGNHEYATPGAAGYFAYFGASAGPAGQGWYSFDLGSWHIVSLNANCAKVRGCDPASPQGRWLAADLATSTAPCTLAMWHQPAFSSARQGGVEGSLPLWQAVARGGVEVVLSAHHHHYERFTPMDAVGRSDPSLGVREIVVGTGGENLAPFATVASTSEARAQAFGVLELTLDTNGYAFRFVGIDGTVLDNGAGTCHGKPA
jgi:hypothetical protein